MSGLVMSHVGLCQLQDPGEIKTSTYIYMVREIPMSFPYNQLSTCPIDNILAPCGSYLDPSPTDAHLLLPVQSGQKYLGQRLACLAVTMHLPWNHSLFDTVCVVRHKQYTLLWSAQQLPLTPGGDLSGMTRIHSVVVRNGI